MNGALIYRPNNRKLTWIAFACAITIHLTAIAIAGNKPKPASAIFEGDLDGPVDGTVDNSPPPIEEVSPPEQVLPPPDPDAFAQDNSTPVPVHPRSKAAIAPIRLTNIGSGKGASAGSVKALTLDAPKPNYPYEARRGGITGTGVAQLRVNNAAGNVIDARMSQSTGSAILDNATLSAFRRWRFKPGVATNVDVPITYTLTGVTY